MPRSQSLEEQPSTSGARPPDDVRPASTDGRSHRKQKKLSKLGRSLSTPVATKSEQSNIELLNPKPNGTTMDESSEESHENKTPIRWMWRKALKSLKTKDKDKMKESDKGTDKDEKKAYSRMNSRQSSLKKGLLKRKDSKEQPVTEEEPELTDEVGEIDPVYSLLKCAADLPRQNKGHTCCLQRGADNLTVRVHSGSNSPSSDSPDNPSSSPNSETVITCSCPCHTPEVLASYHLPLLNSFIIKKS